MPLAFGCPGVLAVLGLEAAAPGECELTRLLQDKLQYEMRLQYMVTPRPDGEGGRGTCGIAEPRFAPEGGTREGSTCRLYSEWCWGAVCSFYRVGQLVPNGVQSCFCWCIFGG